MDRDLVRALAPHLQLLAALGEVEHVTKAAELIGVPQPTVSRTLRALERQLGFPIVERAGRGIRLTPPMRAFIPYANRALGELEDGAARLDESSVQEQVTVRLAFQTSLAEDLVPLTIRQVQQSHPGIGFALQQGARRLCLDLLTDGKAQIALVSDPERVPEGFIPHGLLRQRLVALLPEQHPSSRASTVSVETLVQEPLVTLKRGHGLRDAVDSMFRDASSRPLISFEGEDISTLRGLAAAGLGIAVVPETPAAPRGCVQVQISGGRAWRDIAAVVRSGPLPGAAEFVLQALTQVGAQSSERAATGSASPSSSR